jgi:hypothetical protein
MLTKRALLILICTSFVIGAFAENDSTSIEKKVILKKHSHYLSINATFFLQQFLNFTTSTAVITPSPYIVEYKYLPKHHGFRFDAGGSFSQKKSLLDSSQIQISNTTTFNFRAGYIYQQKIAKHWSFFTGLDVISAINISFLRNNTTEDIVTTTNNAYTFGVGPALGVQFAINDRIGFFVETGLYYQMIWSNQGTTSINFPETNSTSTGTENDFKFIIPTSLFFYFRL